MKINEIIINEGLWDTAKQAGSRVAQAYNSPTGQKIRQGVSNMAGDAVDAARGWAYKNLGIGGEKGLQTAAKNDFVKGFITQYNLARKAAERGGVRFDTSNYVNSYLRKYRYYVGPQQLQQLVNITDPTKLANAMYAVASQQSRDKFGYVDDPRAIQQPTPNYSQGGYKQQTMSTGASTPQPNYQSPKKPAFTGYKATIPTTTMGAGQQLKIPNYPTQQKAKTPDEQGRIEPSFEAKTRKK